MALVYPNTREVAFASLGFLKVFGMLRSRVGLADVSYLWGSRSAAGGLTSLRQRPLLGHFTRREVRSFDVVAFSISYENDFIRVPGLLLSAGIEPRAERRAGAVAGVGARGGARVGDFPLVVFGGFVMSLNPLPIADFADAVVVGEAEPVIDDLLAALSGAQEAGAGKAELLRRLSGIPGVWVPSLAEAPVRRVWAATAAIAPESPADLPGEPGSHFGDMYLVETGRGCGRGCFFCAAGNLYRPVRMRDAATVLAGVEGAGRVGLVGTAVGDHPSLVPILRELIAAGCQVGISSFRADEMTPEIAELLARGGVKSLAIAPEAGSEALRRRINKDISDDQLEAAVKMLAAAGIETIKLYFMIGLPWETDADVGAIVDLVARLARVRGRARLAVAAGPFVPKPHTAFQWCGFEDPKVLKRRIASLAGLRKIRGVSLKVGSLGEAWLEAALAKGDRSLAELLLEAAETGTPVRQLVKARADLSPTRALDMEEPLPWDFIDSGVSGKRLRADFLRAQQR